MLLNAIAHALHTPAPVNERYVSLKVNPATLIGDENDGWLNKHRNPPEIGKPIRVRYLDQVEGIAVRKSDLQYTLRNGDPVSGVIEWRELEVEIRDNVIRN